METIGTLDLINRLGMKIRLKVSSVEDAYAKVREYAKRGFSVTVPDGGLVLPYVMADIFDWSLIGAREFEITDDGTKSKAVLYRGRTYKRREFAAKTTGIKMPAAVKYSRGAAVGDPPHVIETSGDGDKGNKASYVTLAMFRGNGKSIPEYERKS